MKSSYIFDKNVFGTKASNIFVNDKNIILDYNLNDFKNSNYIDIEQITLLNKLFGIENISFPKEKWVNVYKTLMNGKVNINLIPWKQILPKEEFDSSIKEFVEVFKITKNYQK